MVIYSYRLARGQTRWMFTIDLPPASDGRRRQMNRKGFASQTAAQAAETEARKAYAQADLAADGSLAAELAVWLGEREMDVQQTTLGNYHDIVRCYILPHLGARQVYTLNKRAVHDLYKTLLARGGKRGGPLSRTTVRTVHRVRKSKRTVAVGPLAVAALRAHRVRQGAEKAEVGNLYDDGDYLFCREDAGRTTRGTSPRNGRGPVSLPVGA